MAVKVNDYGEIVLEIQMKYPLLTLNNIYYLIRDLDEKRHHLLREAIDYYLEHPRSDVKFNIFDYNDLVFGLAQAPVKKMRDLVNFLAMPCNSNTDLVREYIKKNKLMIQATWIIILTIENYNETELTNLKKELEKRIGTRTTKTNIIAEGTNSTVVSQYKVNERKNESYQSEVQLEDKFIKDLISQGYEYLTFNTEVGLINNLRKQLEELNKYQFTDIEWDNFFRTVLSNYNDGIVEKAKKIQEDSTAQVLIRDDGSTKNIYLIDKVNIHNNKLQVINQYENTGTRDNRYDVTILVNGLPLVHIELKRRGVPIRQAFNQIDRYQRDSFWAGSGLFEYVQIFVISNGTNTKYYSNTTRDAHVKGLVRKKSNTFEFTSFWSDAENNAILDLEDFTRTFFAKHSILNIIAKYCVYTSDNMLLVMRPYQIVATERIVNKIDISHNYKKYGTIDSGGYIWHTTGSGKTLTSFKTAQIATKIPFINKVLFVVDRKDLDYQTMKEYDKFEKGAANSNSNTRILAKQLEDSNSKIIITTIQKLDQFIKKNANHRVYDDEIVIIFDECHRSQFGDMHKSIISKFKKYYIFGFTGTPIFPSNITGTNSYKTTEQIFGDRLHTYTIVDAINDKNVLPFRVDFVKTVDIKEDVKDKKVSAIDTEKALNSPERLGLIVNYIIDNFAIKTNTSESYVHNSLENVTEIAKSYKAEEKMNKKNVNGFNSILATSSIDSAKLYYSMFKRANHNLKIAIIYSYGVNEENDGLVDENNENIDALDTNSRDFLESAIKDYNKMFETSYDTSSEKFQNYYKDISLRMKNKEIDILIVANMFLTGFDAKTLNTLWVDKNLKYHGLIQAFSRTNRIFNSIKTFGNIVCFRDLEDELNDALALFGDRNTSGIVLLKTYDEYYNGYDDFEGYQSLVDRLKADFPIEEVIIGETQQKEFIKLYGTILKVRNILNSFEKFKSDTLLTDRELQNYHSMYIDLYDDSRNKEKADKESILDDVVFEMELIKQIEVNIDYILDLIANYNKSGDKEILVAINKAIGSSVELRNKKDLIEAFIDSLTVNANVHGDFELFMNSKKKEELDKLIKDEGLNKEATYELLERSFNNGQVETNGTEIAKVLPPMSRFSQGNERAIKKNIVVDKLINFFNRFFNISNGKL